MLAVLTVAGAAGTAVGLSGGDDDSPQELDQLEAELEDTEKDAAKRADELESTVTSLQSDLEAVQGLFPVTTDDVLGADAAGTWAATATFTDCTGVEGGADQCKTLGDLEFDMTIGFEGDAFTVESEDLIAPTITRDPSFTYLVDAVPSTALVPDFSCADTTSTPVVALSFRVSSADVGTDGWIALGLAGTLVVTVTPSIPDCDTSVLNYSLTAEPVG